MQRVDYNFSFSCFYGQEIKGSGRFNVNEEYYSNSRCLCYGIAGTLNGDLFVDAFILKNP